MTAGVAVQLLPFSSDPFTAPTDRDMLPSERREFVRTHRTCVFGYARRPPAGPISRIVCASSANRWSTAAVQSARLLAK